MDRNLRGFRRMGWLTVVLVLAAPRVRAAAPAATSQPIAVDPEITRALALYDEKNRLAAAGLAERLLRDDYAPHDRRLLAELAGAGYRDAYLEAPPGQADAMHLCAALRVLTAYLAEPQADPGTSRLRDEIAAIKAQDPAPCPADRAPVVSSPASGVAVPAVGPGADSEVSSATPAPPLRVAPPDKVPARHLRIAGGVTLGLGGALLFGTAYGLVDRRRLHGRMDDIDAAAAGRRLTPEEHADLLDLRSAAVHRRHLILGTSVASAALIAVGVALRVRGRRPAGTKRWAFTPFLGPTSVGLGLQFP